MILTVVLVVIAIAIDQITKYFAVEYLRDIATFPIIEDVLHLTYVENRGAAFGMLSDHRWVFMVLSVVGISAMIAWLAIEKPKSVLIRTAVSLIVGGGIGNMIDRVALGYVVDFIDCRFIDFYVFNGADSFVCVGCGLFVLAVIFDEISERKKKKALNSGDGASDSVCDLTGDEPNNGNNDECGAADANEATK